MSLGRVEAMRAAMAAFNRRDGEAFGAVFAEDAEIVPVRAAVDGTVYRGPDAGAQYCAAVEDSWENLRWEIEELREGGDWVLALGHIRGQGRHSGVDIDARAGWVARFRKGEVTNFQHLRRSRRRPRRRGVIGIAGPVLLSPQPRAVSR